MTLYAAHAHPAAMRVTIVPERASATQEDAVGGLRQPAILIDRGQLRSGTGRERDWQTGQPDGIGIGSKSGLHPAKCRYRVDSSVRSAGWSNSPDGHRKQCIQVDDCHRSMEFLP